MFLCKDATLRMTEEREGTLSGWDRVRYKAHLLICLYCKRYRRQLGETIVLSKEVPADEVPSSVEQAALMAFRARRGGGPAGTE
jgi:hypothetical protein